MAKTRARTTPPRPTDPRPAKFDPDLLTIVTTYFNPIQYDSRQRLYAPFAQHMRDAGMRLLTIECALGDRPFEVTTPRHPYHLQVRVKSVTWLKENLVNLALRSIAPETQYVGWIDADITFRDPHWATETIHALQHYAIVQPWSDCYDLGPHGEHMEHHRSFASLYRRNAPRGKGYCAWHPGFAWCARRDALDAVGGLFDFGILGSGDAHMAFALIGQVSDSFPGPLSAGYTRELRTWQERARRAFDGNLGYVPGTIEHSFHGRKQDRQYLSRRDIIRTHQLDPDLDVRRNLNGVYELAGNKPAMRDAFDRYFRQRKEDVNFL